MEAGLEFSSWPSLLCNPAGGPAAGAPGPWAGGPTARPACALLTYPSPSRLLRRGLGRPCLLGSARGGSVCHSQLREVFWDELGSAWHHRAMTALDLQGDRWSAGSSWSPEKKKAKPVVELVNGAVFQGLTQLSLCAPTTCDTPVSTHSPLSPWTMSQVEDHILSPSTGVACWMGSGLGGELTVSIGSGQWEPESKQNRPGG